jgi:uncharacterized protein (TIGR00730 family)
MDAKSNLREAASHMTAPLHRICVFAGSSVGHQLSYAAAAEQLGLTLAQQRIGLVYGGGGVGLMGRMADAALAAGGEVIGVIPEALHQREAGHTRLTELHVVSNMHQRKAMMASYADAFMVLPGGLGTLEETFEIWTWGQLGFHRKPIGLLVRRVLAADDRDARSHGRRRVRARAASADRVHRHRRAGAVGAAASVATGRATPPAPAWRDLSIQKLSGIVSERSPSAGGTTAS